MELDVTKRYDEILGADGHLPRATFKERILDAAQHQISRAQTQHWASHLRFLSSDNSDQAGGLCNVCNAWPSFQPGDRVLRLTQPHEAGSCRHYIAVSYCWEHHLEECSSSKDSYLIKTVSGDRPNKAPTNIISRAISFALDTAPMNLIWIDQECIDQNDRLDKEFGIQSMDQVYHKAKILLGLLNVTVKSQSEMDILAKLMEGQTFGTEPEMQAAVALLYRISQDRWFSRAWIFQESCLSLNLTLLVRHAEGLEKPDVCGQIPGEVKISMDRLQRWATLVFASVRQFPQGPLLDTLWQIEEIEFWATSLFPQIKTYEFSTKRFACSAAEALYHLNFRVNSRPADRLAIIANLCQYHTRLNTTELNLKTTSFSVSLFTLSILNGDTSLLIDFLRDAKTRKLMREALAKDGGSSSSWNSTSASQRKYHRQQSTNDISSNFSWSLPLLSRFPMAGNWESSSYSNGFDPNMRLQMSEIRPEGLHTTGWIWNVNNRIDLSKLRNKLLTRRKSCNWNYVTDYSYVPEDPLRYYDDHEILKLNNFSSDFICHLLEELSELDLPEVADAVWHLTRPTWHKQWGNRWFRFSETPQWLQEINNDRDINYASEFNNQCPKRPVSLDQLFDPVVRASFMKVAEDCWHAPSHLSWLFDQVMEKGFLYCGHLLQEEKEANCVPRVIFDCEEPILVFTPYTEEACTITGPVQPRVNPLSWIVSMEKGQPESRPLLSCNQIVQGIWEKPDKLFQEVLLM